MSDSVIKRLREARMQWVELPHPEHAGLAVRIMRPSEVEVTQHLFKEGGAQDGKGATVSVEFADVLRATVDWRGFTEAGILGAAVGSSDPLPFSAHLWAELASDHAAWVRLLASAILQAAVEHHTAKAAAEKNS
jgi:hypothetical protein